MSRFWTNVQPSDVADVFRILGRADVDNDMAAFALDKVVSHVCNFCHFDLVPEELETEVLNAAVGEYLNLAWRSGRITVDDAERIAKSITQGDTSVSFKDYETAEERMGAWIRALSVPDSLLVNYRRVKFV